MALIDWRPISEMSGFAGHDTPGRALSAHEAGHGAGYGAGGVAAGRSVTAPRRMRRRVAQWVATCAMGAWVLLAIVPVVVVIMAIGG